MVKVPGTASGALAIRQLIVDGLNINVTLLFSLVAYQAVTEAYLAGLEARAAKGDPIDRIASVASFFVSRIDSAIDKAIDARAAAGDPEARALMCLRGKVAIANAKIAYAWSQDLVASPRWQALAAKGAMIQRLLWASTGTKDPAYPDTLYIDALIGPETVNTMPPKTMDAFRDHGAGIVTITQGLDDARQVLAQAERLGLDLGSVTTTLVADGVRQFADATDALLGAVAEKRATYLGDRLNGFEAILPQTLADAVGVCLETARAEAWPRRLFRGDATLWTAHDEGNWLGWVAAATDAQVDPGSLDVVRTEAKRFSDAVLLGMGGSSLGPEVIATILASAGDGATLHVLDTSDPGQIAKVVAKIDPLNTLFIVSSKSGSTMEPELLRAYFWELSGKDGSRFMAITDAGSKLEAAARTDGFAHVFAGDKAIGGRYSVLSAFGIVPAAVIGLDVRAFFVATAPMVFSCGPDVPPSANPGFRLGAILGQAALAGRNKVTILASAQMRPFGAWLEQLLAESTGKQGKGIVPVDLEPIGARDAYGPDRLFVHLHLAGDEDEGLEAKLEALTDSGQPLVRVVLASKELIGQEFYRWEVATAVAGAVIGINPFDQPDVEDAKVATRTLIDAYEAGKPPEAEKPIAETADFALFAPKETMPVGDDIVSLLRNLFRRLLPGGYMGFLAYIERNPANEAVLETMRTAVRDVTGAATVVGFGPRFLHSTGQTYKGGPAGGVFLTITRDAAPDLAIPGYRASFGTVQIAQAQGDAQVLAERDRSVLRVHLKAGGGGLPALHATVVAALEGYNQ